MWAKYALSDSEPWFKFAICKTRGPRITFPTLPKFSQPLPVKPSKVKDAERLATKYVPDDLCDYHVYGLYKQPILQTYYAIFDTKFIVTKYNI